MDYSLKKLWNLISLLGILLIFIDLFTLIFLASTSPNINHFPIDKSYQSYLIKYQIIFVISSLIFFLKYKTKYLFVRSTLIWFFCLINSILSLISSLMQSGIIYDISLIILIFCVFSSSFLMMILRKYS